MYLVIFVILVLSSFFLTAFFVPKMLDVNVYRDSLEEWLSYEFARDVTARDIDIKLINGSKIVLKDVSIDDDPAFSKEPFLKSEEVVLSIRFFPLIKGELVVTGITFAGADLTIIENESGKYNVSSLGSGTYKSHHNDSLTSSDLSGTPKSPFKKKSAEIERVALTDTTINFNRTGADDVTNEAVKLKEADIILSDLRLQDNENISDIISKSGETRFERSSIFTLFRSSTLPLSGRLSLDIPFGVFFDSPFEDLKLTATIKDNVFKVDEIGLKLFGGIVRSKGFIDLSGKTPELVVNSSISGVMANKLIGIVCKGDETFFGKTTFEGTFTGKGKSIDEMSCSLSGEGIFRIEDGIIPAFSIRAELLSLGLIPRPDLPEDLDTRFTIIGGSFLLSEGEFKTSTIILKSPEWDAFARGTLNMDGEIDVKGNIFLTDSMALELKTEYIPSLIRDTAGRLSIPFKITGNLQNPEFLLRPKFLMKKNADEIFEEFKRELEKQNKEEFTIKFIRFE
ncbi:MAG: hypothetical protein JW984_12675 [Deltaproteobacteria bacterium]|uniref:AsmA domain-containing protein n=1 Tax=Candidatus Zymogenus saltonus TaxID=2844893 RepID=A0A9D8KGI5_9DELT|nr:hypothetical protein [Candidatus Zymogenus saltonus]